MDRVDPLEVDISLVAEMGVKEGQDPGGGSHKHLVSLKPWKEVEISISGVEPAVNELEVEVHT